jgi:serine/threonine protein kinase
MYESFPINKALHVLLGTCYALREAHQKGLVHRDIKPMNIMLCNQGGSYDLVKLLDFGLVKQLDTNETQHTQLNRIGGSPMLMAPERLRDPYNADQRVDIYSVGAVGLYILSGKYLMEMISSKMMIGQQTIEGDLDQLIQSREDVPKELEQLLVSCIHFDPAKRPVDIDEVISTLEKLQMAFPYTYEEAKEWWKAYDVKA